MFHRTKNSRFSLVLVILSIKFSDIIILCQTTCNNGLGRVLYERLPNQQLQGFDDDVVRDTAAPFRVLEKCQDLCLRDRTASNNLVRACSSFDFQPGSRIASFNGNTEYEESTCYLTREQPAPEGIGILMLVPNSVHFTEICLSSNRPERECPSRRYVFERHPRKKLKLPVSDIKEISAANRSDCEDKCFNEFSFVCRSANFDSNLRSCTLSRFTRRTHPELLEDDSNVDYLENTCLNAERRCDGLAVFIKEENKRLGGPFEVDIFKNMTLEECQTMCLRAEKYFCRSIEFDDQSKICILSEEDSISQKDDISISSSPTHHFYDLVCLDNQRGSEYPENSVTSHLFSGGRRPDTAFQRFRNSRLGGEFHSEITGRSLSECLDECLRQTSFQCRSAVYSDRFRTCRLSRYNQRDGMRIIYDADYDYYENLMLGSEGEDGDRPSTRPGEMDGSNHWRPPPYGGSDRDADMNKYPDDRLPARYPPSAGYAPYDRYPTGSVTNGQADRYPNGPTNNERYPADKYPTDRYPNDRYPADRYPADRYPADRYPVDRYPIDRLPTDRLPPERYPNDRLPSERYPNDRLPSDRYPSDKYPADRQPTDRYPYGIPDRNRNSNDMNNAGVWRPQNNDPYVSVSNVNYRPNMGYLPESQYGPYDNRLNPSRYPARNPGDYDPAYPNDEIPYRGFNDLGYKDRSYLDRRYPERGAYDINFMNRLNPYDKKYPDRGVSINQRYPNDNIYPEYYDRNRYPNDRIPNLPNDYYNRQRPSSSNKRYPDNTEHKPISPVRYNGRYPDESYDNSVVNGRYPVPENRPGIDQPGTYPLINSNQFPITDNRYPDVIDRNPSYMNRFGFRSRPPIPTTSNNREYDRWIPPYGIRDPQTGRFDERREYNPNRIGGYAFDLQRPYDRPYDNGYDNAMNGNWGDGFGGLGPERPHSSRCDDLDKFKQIGIRQRVRRQYVRRVLPVPSLIHCQRACIEAKAFICRSFNYRDTTSLSYDSSRVQVGNNNDNRGGDVANCELSDRDTRELDLQNPQMFDGGNYDYYERSLSNLDNECLDVSQTCNEDGMEFTLRTPEGFVGRIYTYGFYDRCFFRGTGGTINVLRISGAQGYPECGTQRYGDTMTNIIVVQFSDNVQTGRDKRFNLTCIFRGPGEAVVTSGYIGAGSGSPIPIEYLPAENTLSSKVRLMILYQNRPTTTIAVGDPLTFRLEAQDGYNHITDIFATNVIARDPYSGRSIQLIDKYGCPVDPYVFPELDKLRNGDSLEARFNAFKIPESNFLVFEATVRSCREGCQPAYCQTGSAGRSEPSFGRKRRSLNDTVANSTVEEVFDINNEIETKNESDFMDIKMMMNKKNVEYNDTIVNDFPEHVREMIEVFESREEIENELIPRKLVLPIETVCLTKSEYQGIISAIVLLLILLLSITSAAGLLYKRFWVTYKKNRNVNLHCTSAINSFTPKALHTNISSNRFINASPEPQHQSVRSKNKQNSKSNITLFSGGLQKTFATGNLSRMCQMPVINPIRELNSKNGSSEFNDPSEPIYTDPSLFERARSMESIAGF